jgi:hypothetical protein
MCAELRRLVLAICLIWPWTLSAVVLEPLSVAALTARADIVVQGVVRKTTCERDAAGRIYTKVELEVNELWKGAIAGSPLIVVHGGGALGTRQSAVSGQVHYHVGEEVVAFLVRNERGEGVTVGLLQGKFEVWKEPETGTKFVRNFFHGAGSGAAVSLQSANSSSTRLSLEDLRRQVREGSR